MNRLTVYRYLTRYPYGHSRSDTLFTVPLADSKIFDWPRRFFELVRTNPAPNSTSSYRGPSFQDLTSALNEPSQIIINECCVPVRFVFHEFGKVCEVDTVCTHPFIFVQSEYCVSMFTHIQVSVIIK